MKARILINILILSILLVLPAWAEVYWQDRSPTDPIPYNEMNWSTPYGFGNSPFMSQPQYNYPYSYFPNYSSPFFGKTLTQPYQYPNYSRQGYYYVPSPTYYGWTKNRNGGYEFQGMKKAYSPQYGEVYLPEQYAYNSGSGPFTNQPYTPPGYTQPAFGDQYNQNNNQDYGNYQSDQNNYYQPYVYGPPKTADQFVNWWDTEEYKKYQEQWAEYMKNNPDQQENNGWTPGNEQKMTETPEKGKEVWVEKRDDQGEKQVDKEKEAKQKEEQAKKEKSEKEKEKKEESKDSKK